MSILVFGRTGEVAQELQRQGDMIALGHDQADLSQPGQCVAAIAAHAPAYTAVDRGEDEETLATAINGTAPGKMAQACAAAGIPRAHISNDYVFRGMAANGVST